MIAYKTNKNYNNMNQTIHINKYLVSHLLSKYISINLNQFYRIIKYWKNKIKIIKRWNIIIIKWFIFSNNVSIF